MLDLVKVEKNVDKYVLNLYITGRTSCSQRAIVNLKKICSENLKGKYSLKIIDVLESPHLAEVEKILATPTLVKELPLPIRRIIGDLSQVESVLFGLDIYTKQ